MERLMYGIAGCCLIGACVTFWLEQPIPNALTLVQDTFEVGKVPIGQEQNLTVIVRNNSAQDWRVVGILNEAC